MATAYTLDKNVFRNLVPQYILGKVAKFCRYCLNSKEVLKGWNLRGHFPPPPPSPTRPDRVKDLMVSYRVAVNKVISWVTFLFRFFENSLKIIGDSTWSSTDVHLSCQMNVEQTLPVATTDSSCFVLLLLLRKNYILLVDEYGSVSEVYVWGATLPYWVSEQGVCSSCRPWDAKFGKNLRWNYKWRYKGVFANKGLISRRMAKLNQTFIQHILGHARTLSNQGDQFKWSQRFQITQLGECWT